MRSRSSNGWAGVGIYAGGNEIYSNIIQNSTYDQNTDYWYSAVLKQGNYYSDANGDGGVNILDAAKIGLAWNTKYGDAKYDDGADLNSDDWVNVIDGALVGLNWGRKAQVMGRASGNTFIVP